MGYGGHFSFPNTLQWGMQLFKKGIQQTMMNTFFLFHSNLLSSMASMFKADY